MSGERERDADHTISQHQFNSLVVSLIFLGKKDHRVIRWIIDHHPFSSCGCLFCWWLVRQDGDPVFCSDVFIDGLWWAYIIIIVINMIHSNYCMFEIHNSHERGERGRGREKEENVVDTSYHVMLPPEKKGKKSSPTHSSRSLESFHLVLGFQLLFWAPEGIIITFIISIRREEEGER